MSNVSAHSDEPTSAQQLTELVGVTDYLKKSPIRTVEVQRIQTGAVNFVYRLFLSQPLGQTQQNTAILKYSAPYVASAPHVLFSSDRQVFEARALTHIPWRQFRYHTAPVDKPVSACSRVNLPEVYLEDRENHLTIVEDCTPRTGENRAWGQVIPSLWGFCEYAAKSERKYQTARDIGCLLGMFLAQLHAWGRSPNDHQQAIELFGANKATNLTVEATLTDFFKNVSEIGYQITQEQQIALALRIRDLELAIQKQTDTVVMGDFWPGNVLISFDKANNLSKVSVIDWEFVAIGPAFLDVGNFIGELFSISFFESTDSTYAIILDSFIEAYGSFGGSLDVKQTLGFAGAAIIMSLPRRINSERSRATKTSARECVEHALNFITHPESTYLVMREDDPFKSMSRLMGNR